MEKRVHHVPNLAENYIRKAPSTSNSFVAEYSSKVLGLLQSAVWRIVFKGTFRTALLVQATLVECGVNMDMSIPAFWSTIFVQHLIVSRPTALCGTFTLMKCLVSAPLNSSVLLTHCLKYLTTHNALSDGNAPKTISL